MTARVVTDSAYGTFAFTSREACNGIAGSDERAGWDVLMGTDDDVDITSIEGYSPKVSYLWIDPVLSGFKRTVICLGSCHCCYTDSNSHSGSCNESAKRRHRGGETGDESRTSLVLSLVSSDDGCLWGLR